MKLEKLTPIVRFLQVTKLISILLMFISAKAGFDLIGTFTSGSFSTILFFSFNTVTIVGNAKWAIFVYIMVFGWMFTNALGRVYLQYHRHLVTGVLPRVGARICKRKSEAKQE